MGRPRKKPKEAEDQSAPKNGKVGKKGAKLKPTPRVTRGRKAKEEVKVPVEAVESSDESNSDWEEVLNTGILYENI